MAFHHLYFDGLRPGLAAKDTDQGCPAVGFDIDPGEVVKPVGRSLVNRKMLGAVGFYNVAERRERFTRERRWKEFERFQD